MRDREATRIKLLVNVEDGNLTSRQVDQIPVVERSTINTQALIAEGESLLIGGMTRDAVSSSVDKVPGLGDVPVVGNLFKSKTNSSSRIERMFLITPRLSGARAALSGPALAPAPAPAAAPAPATPAPAAPSPTLRTAQAEAVVPRPAPPAPAPRESEVLDLDAMPAAATRVAAPGRTKER